jgi:transcriptional regulator with XRE-family HTH domain
MSTGLPHIADTGVPLEPNQPVHGAATRLHRIRTVRERQGVSLRSASRQTGVEIRRLRMQEDETSDLLLSTLYKWQKALDVPISELLVDDDDPLSPVVLDRCRMLKIMKTVAAIIERSNDLPTQRLAMMLQEQLLELAPDMKGVSPWHSVGRRRTAEEFGRVIERSLPDHLFE